MARRVTQTTCAVTAPRSVMGCGASASRQDSVQDSVQSSVAELAQSTPADADEPLLSEPIAPVAAPAEGVIDLADTKGDSIALDETDSLSRSADSQEFRESRDSMLSMSSADSGELDVRPTDSEQSKSHLLSKRPGQRASGTDTREQSPRMSSSKAGEARDISPGRSRPDSNESSRSRKNSTTPPSPAEPRRQRREIEERVDERKLSSLATSAKRGAAADDDDGGTDYNRPAPKLRAAALSHIGANSNEGKPVKEENQVAPHTFARPPLDSSLSTP